MKEEVLAVMAFAYCAFNYAVESGFDCDEAVLYDVLRTDAYEDELVNAFKAIGADKFYEHMRYITLTGNSRRERELYGYFLHELMPIFERHAKVFYHADDDSDDYYLDNYIASLLESGCLLKEEVAYLTDDRNRDEMRVLYNHVWDLMKEPVDPDNDDSCLVGDFLEFDEVFGTELSIRTSKYLEERYAKYDMNIVAGAFNNTAQSGYKPDKYTGGK